MGSTEISELRRSIEHMRQNVAGLRARYGNIAPVQRVANDLERLAIDAAELADLDTAPAQRRSSGIDRDIVVMQDTPYDDSLWHDADDEGVGGLRQR